MTYVGLLRGINVGGQNKLPMKDLVAMFTAAGCAGTQTFIQSGNVIFTAKPALAARLPVLVAAQIAERYGYRSPVVLRTTEQVAQVLAGNPFLKAGAPPDGLHVMFLDVTPAAQRVAALDPQRSPGDEYRVCGQEIYLRLPNGVARSKLTNAYFDSKLATTSTARNWRTVGKLYDLMCTCGS